MKKIIKEIRLKKDTPDHRAGERFVLMSNNGIYEIDAGKDDPAVFYGGDIKNFDEWFEEVKESGWWKPKKGERYYFIDGSGYIKSDTWHDVFWEVDRYGMGNVFKTETATKHCRDYLGAIATVHQDEGVIDLQGIGEEYETAPENKYNDFSVYTVAFNLYLRKIVVIDADEYISANAIWFDTKEHAQSSLDNHPDEWKIIVNYDWGRETEYVYKERHAELSNNGKEDK